MGTEGKVSLRERWRRYMLVEPPVFFLLFANGMTGNVISDLIVFQSCKEVMEANRSSCDILHTNSSSSEAEEMNKIVQPYASNVIMCRSLVESILPSFLVLFLGSWSDKFGRKPLMISGCIAAMCKYLIFSVLTNFDENPWMFLIASVPTSILGNSLLLATFCWITDSTEPDYRAWSLACLQSCITTGLILGTFIGPLIFGKVNYSVLFIIAAIFCAASTVYIIFLVPETRRNESNKKWGNPFDFSVVKELLFICLQKREGFNYKILWSCLGILTLFTIVINGNSNITFLYATAKLGWNLQQFSVFSGISLLLSTIGTFGGLKIMKNRLEMSDLNMALVGSISGFSATLLGSLITQTWHIYLLSVLGIFTGIVLPTTRSLLSKSASAENIGKIFSLVSLVETILPLGSAPLFHLLYSSYIFVYPSPVFLLMAGSFLLMAFIIIIVNYKFMRSELSYQETVQEN